MDVLGKLFGRSVDLIGKTLDLRLKKHSFIASNMANIDTPNYEVKDLQFQKILPPHYLLCYMKPKEYFPFLMRTKNDTFLFQFE